VPSNETPSSAKSEPPPRDEASERIAAYQAILELAEMLRGPDDTDGDDPNDPS
jgi:hypothetical protein